MSSGGAAPLKSFFHYYYSLPSVVTFTRLRRTGGIEIEEENFRTLRQEGVPSSERWSGMCNSIQLFNIFNVKMFHYLLLCFVFVFLVMNTLFT